MRFLIVISFYSIVLISCKQEKKVKQEDYKNAIIIAVSPDGCVACNHKGKIAEFYDSVLPVKYLFNIHDTNEINFVMSNQIETKKPYLINDTLFKKLTDKYDGASSISIIDKNGKVVLNEYLKTSDLEAFEKELKKFKKK